MPRMEPEPEDAPEMENGEEQVEEGQEAVIQGETSWLSNSPWWLISAGIHIVLLLGLTLVVIEKNVPIDEGEVLVTVTPQNKAVIQEPERPRDVFERKGIPKDEPAAPTDEPAIFFPEAKESDHNESADNEDYHQMKGDSKEFLSYIPGEAGGFRGRQQGPNKGVYDTMGVGGGGGGGGRYGGRFGGRENLVARGGGTRATESAVTEALKWLCRHQGSDGAWRAKSFSAQCSGGTCSGIGEEDYDAGLTALSLLAFLGAGYTHMSRDKLADNFVAGKSWDVGKVVKNAMQWLIGSQDQEGCIGGRGNKYRYNHAIAALALSEAYGMTQASNLKESAQKGIDFIVSAQNPGKGWRYSSKCGDNDTSVSGWCVMALKSAEMSELTFPRSAYDGALSWITEATATDGYYLVGYNRAGTGKVYVKDKNEQFENHPSMSSVAVMSRIFMQKNKKEPALQSVLTVVQDLPEWKTNKIDFYYWYYSSLAIFQYDGPDGPTWKKWNEPMKNALVPNQKVRKDGCQNGSWAPEEERWGFEGGRVYATAINALTLEVYYRYKSVFGTKDKSGAK